MKEDQKSSKFVESSPGTQLLKSSFISRNDASTNDLKMSSYAKVPLPDRITPKLLDH